MGARIRTLMTLLPALLLSTIVVTARGGGGQKQGPDFEVGRTTRRTDTTARPIVDRTGLQEKREVASSSVVSTTDA